ncbi:MAG: four helix bundle protein [Phycisphaerae bacterium]|nr:four helix bundle protein [Phycisphaerae bacterium]
MNQEEMKARTQAFALRIIRLTESLPASRTADVIGKQLLRSGTSVGANYRAACRAKSTADFVSKLGTVEEEADECGYWMELLVQAELVNKDQLSPLIQEAHELAAIVVASIKTARSQL